MNRSVLSYPLNRGADWEGGGAGDLQTDVMRFMAILALCLVAIFALVQSLPMAPPTPRAPDPVIPKPDRPPVVAQPAEQTKQPIEAPTPPAAEPRRLSLPPAAVYAETETVSEQPLPLASTMAPMPETASSPSSPAPEQEGFVLRFESDRALFQLVERDAVSLYAIDGGDVRRLSVRGGSASFWPASQPRQFHEMDRSTVPATVVGALRAGSADVTWGVTLPADLRDELGRYLAAHRGGTLIIGSDGKLRREP